MAVQLIDPDRVTSIELLWKLKENGYDTDKLEELSKHLGVDLPEILAGWTPILARLFAAPKQSWWRRFLSWKT